MVTEKSLQESVYTEQEEGTFQWTKQWYPVAVAEFLDPLRPHALQLLGKDLVLWCDNANQWHCFDDFCPHRGAPFSEGRVEADGTLMCAYHAWRFDSQGNCVSIPQSKDKETEAKHCTNPKSCAVTYPIQERQGLLWVWPESSLQGKLESQLRQPRLVPELEEKSDRVVKKYWSMRDLPYGWDFFMENVSDPAHVPVSHHGLMGNRYNDPKYYDMIAVKPLSTQEGFAYEIIPTADIIEQAVHDFQPPCHMRISATYKDGGKFILALYAIPTRPGWCRHIGCQVFVKNNQGKLPSGIAFYGLPMPAWLGHVLASLFLHQDLVFLHYQEKSFAKRGKDKWMESVYTPNPQDKMVIALRKWLKNRAGGDIPWETGSNSELSFGERDKERLFDVWTTHTQECKVCQDALKNINRLSLLAYIGAIVCLSVGTAAGFWLGVGGALVLALVGYYLKRFSRLFYVYKFEHADNN